MSSISNNTEGLDARMVQLLEATLDFLLRLTHKGIQILLSQEFAPKAIHDEAARTEIERK